MEIKELLRKLAELTPAFLVGLSFVLVIVASMDASGACSLVRCDDPSAYLSGNYLMLAWFFVLIALGIEVHLEHG